MASAEFSHLLSELATAHKNEIQRLREEHSAATSEFIQQISSLRSQLGNSQQRDIPDRSQSSNLPITLAPGDLDPLASLSRQTSPASDHTSVCSRQSAPAHRFLTLKDGWSRHAIWGAEQIVLPSHEEDGSRDIRLAAFKVLDNTRIPGFFDCKKGVIFPHSQFRTSWDMASLFLIFIDVLLIPFILAFDPPSTSGLAIIDWISLSFWSVDMMQGPFMGYFHQGEYVDSLRLVFKHYLKTWFMIDMLVVVPEWLVVLLGADEDNALVKSAAIFRIIKSVRVIRVLRLLRLVKVKALIQKIYDMSSSEVTFIVLNVVQLIIFIMLLNHLLACAWYKVGDTDEGWVAILKKHSEDSLSYLYLTSLHWSVTQFSTAAMDVNPGNNQERVFSILVLFCAMVVFSSFVGTISDHITRIRGLGSDVTRQLWLLRRFLREHQVSTNLSERIEKFVEHKAFSAARRSNVSEIDILQKLSAALHDELSYELHQKYVCVHPFFLYLSARMNLQSTVMHRVCKTALQVCQYAKEELIFSAGDEAVSMFIVQSGISEYSYATLSGHLQHILVCTDPLQTQSERWLAEAVLWTVWRHRGNFVAGPHPSELILVHPDRFFDVISKHPRTWLYATIYGEQFIGFINSLTELTDIITTTPFYDMAAAKACNVAADNYEDPNNMQQLSSFDKQNADDEKEPARLAFMTRSRSIALDTVHNNNDEQTHRASI